ncbi:MAG: hypothetical protein ACJA0U_003567, partial [Salibacteraceae bacterium]
GIDRPFKANVPVSELKSIEGVFADPSITKFTIVSNIKLINQHI